MPLEEFQRAMPTSDNGHAAAVLRKFSANIRHNSIVLLLTAICLLQVAVNVGFVWYVASNTAAIEEDRQKRIAHLEWYKTAKALHEEIVEQAESRLQAERVDAP